MCPDFMSSGLLRTCRQCVRCVTLLAYLLVTSGVSLPQIGFEPKQASESFPCAGRGCGCATAEQCWRQCCCTSLENRLGWANQKKIQPPEWIAHFPGEVSRPPTGITVVPTVVPSNQSHVLMLLKTPRRVQKLNR